MVTGDRSGLAPIWNDEDERAFYAAIPDLKATMPSMAYKDSLAESSTSSAAPQATDDAMSVLDAVIQADSDMAAGSEKDATDESPAVQPEASTNQVTTTGYFGLRYVSSFQTRKHFISK